ncbi:MAG: tRNA (adenosine(37)-N6)-threonylcarbamoyltransferase complex dimerization subunit type 1 TsaB [Clostridium sp.]|jgi:universal bacterial protein yeaZ|uniref:tRNA (adenosine(37)-N6)-threonylcarbamoyltransferase complex dimerization subunit type 1 TsaB n=1 Tax=Butyribacter sp. TaxID=2822465 RepID=UPI002A9C0418|nr:tRNA (adenosine(37)-N6)-threonylcarbamoyltransferase complex dimerization subunit type 1 TsaB [Clostridium sp.]MDY5180392.1 tRNA (adenosine(37)-N6)-threonylcarbamoyltransferase complex dimerization subunit type 1 TsaB [Butyribacter sp.]
MKILGIDSSGLVASAAIADEKNIIAEFTVNNKQTHSQTLLPMIEKVVDMSGIELEQIDAIAIAAGPGSFTGLRIGSATAKGIGLALKKPVVSVPTLEGLAYRVSVFDGIICPIMDARRNQVYTGIYKMDKGNLVCLSEQKAVDIHEIMEELEKYDEKVIFLGDGVEVQRETIEKEFKKEYCFAPIHLSKQSAAAVAVLGDIYFNQGKAEDAAEHKPIYLRKSQAEREREERLKKQD